MEIVWNNRHGKILNDLIISLNKNKIKYFILRNYAKLPNINLSKDVDIIFEPRKFKESKRYCN